MLLYSSDISNCRFNMQCPRINLYHMYSLMMLQGGLVMSSNPNNVLKETFYQSECCTIEMCIKKLTNINPNPTPNLIIILNIPHLFKFLTINKLQKLLLLWCLAV